MRKLRAAFVGFILADLSMLLVAQGPRWDKPKNTSLYLDSSRSDVCDRVTYLDATSATGDSVLFNVVYQDPDVGFKVVPDMVMYESVLQCSLEKIEDRTYTVVIRANYSSGSPDFTDLTLNITFTKSESDTDDCAADPCKNGGNCTDLIDGYNCTCKPGFNGTNCEINIDECAGDPCENGGECTDLFDGYNCTCKPGYNGTNCENNIDECVADPCKNGGECTDLVDGYNCTCKPGYNGTNCEINIDECAGAPCENGGECKDLINSYTCTCKSGFTGTTCGTNIDECATRPCKNGGICTDQVNGYSCTCKPGYAGTTCETDTPTGLCECHSDNYWDGKNCVAKASICTGSCDTTALAIVIALLSIAVVILVVYVVYLNLKMKRNSGQLGIVSKDPSVRPKYQEPKYVNVAYVEDETHANEKLEIRAQGEDARTPDVTNLNKDMNEFDATEGKNEDKLPTAKSEIQAKAENIRNQTKGDLDDESNDSTGSDDDSQNAQNVNGTFTKDEKHPEAQLKIQEQPQNLKTLRKYDQDEITEMFNAPKDEGNTGKGESSEDKENKEINNEPNETEIRNVTQNVSNKSDTSDKN